MRPLILVAGAALAVAACSSNMATTGTNSTGSIGSSGSTSDCGNGNHCLPKPNTN